MMVMSPARCRAAQNSAPSGSVLIRRCPRPASAVSPLAARCRPPSPSPPSRRSSGAGGRAQHVRVAQPQTNEAVSQAALTGQPGAGGQPTPPVVCAGWRRAAGARDAEAVLLAAMAAAVGLGPRRLRREAAVRKTREARGGNLMHI